MVIYVSCMYHFVHMQMVSKYRRTMSQKSSMLKMAVYKNINLR